MTGPNGGMNTMLDVRKARKRAEADVQLLANRLQHLRFEEERAHKKIHETKSRTAHVLVSKHRNASGHENKMSSKATSELYQTHERRRVVQARTQQKRYIGESRKMVERERKKQAELQREQTRKLAEHQRQQREAKEEMNRQRAEAIRLHEKAVLEKRERQRLERELRMQQEYCRRVQEEALRQQVRCCSHYRPSATAPSVHTRALTHTHSVTITQEAERLVLLMEKEEAELIERLRNTQSLQRAAYDQLQATLDV